MKLPKIKEWVNEEQLAIKAGQYDPFTLNSHGDYCYAHECDFDELHRDVIVQELVKHRYIICGDTHQHCAIPVFEDGYLLVSMRVWASIMEDAYFQMNPTAYPEPWFYMATTCTVKENLPKCE